jgi:hypothetical protein
VEEAFGFNPIARNVDDVLRRQVVGPRALQITVSGARQTFPPPTEERVSTEFLIFAGTVVFGDDENDEQAEVEEVNSRTDWTATVKLRDPNSSGGADRVAGSASFVAEASIANDTKDSFGIKVECGAVRANSDDVYLLSNVGANIFGELARMAYQATVLEQVGPAHSGAGNGFSRHQRLTLQSAIPQLTHA